MTRGKQKEHDDDTDDGDNSPPGKVRVDKWLWAARFFKTRSLAQEAVDGGKVEVNGERAKRAKLVQAGDRVQLRQGAEFWQLTVLDIAARRGSAEIAATLYEESAEGRVKRQALRDELRSANTGFTFGEGRPGKRDRRELKRFKGD
ncbi:MAG: RNA-binding S4 domain-containing protein [Phycisphaerae bacterium]|nr:RNA-binding S4 domain-containing protein [Gemmatimonadaceae bacterium]